MTIKEVEQKTGLGRSNIRFYEKEKLIEPSKNSSNGYRDYSQEDVNLIKKIAYLRTLGISIEEIRSIISQKVTLYEIVKSQSEKLEGQIAELQNAKIICERMMQAKKLDFEDLIIEEYISHADDYWKKNRKLLRFDVAGFFYKWGSVTTWMILFFLCIAVALVSYPLLPSDIPVQWSEGIATSWVSKHFIFAYPIALVLLRIVLRPILYGKLQMYTLYGGMVTEYAVNSICLMVLSVEIFSVLFVAGLVKNIVFILFTEAILLTGLLLFAK